MLFDVPQFAGHRRVMFGFEPACGLKAIIAVHSTRRGPAVGGCRMLPYDSAASALADALRLSCAMSYKTALAELPFGGGKAVIIGDPRTDKTPELLRAFGRIVESLGGEYITAEDVGMSPDDMAVVAEATAHVAGLTSGRNASGDPAAATALGVLHGLAATANRRLGTGSLSGLTVAVQGLGRVGWQLCELLHEHGVKLVVSDIDADKVRAAEERLAAVGAAPDRVHAVTADIFAPCALGGVLNEQTVAQLAAAAVAGSANNQLAHPNIDHVLAARGILYAPDYAINAGGVINVCGEILGHYDPVQARAAVARIGRTLAEVFDRAEEWGVPPGAAADRLARARLDAALTDVRSAA